MKIHPLFRGAVALGFAGYGFWAAELAERLGLSGNALFAARLIAPPIGIGFAVLALLIQNTVVFRIGWLWWNVRHLCRHVIIIGDTGSGKTLGAMNFIQRQYLMNIRKGGAFIVGTKGDEPDYAREVCRYAKREADFKLLQFRPDDAPADWSPPAFYNFVSDRSLPWTAHAKAIVDTASANTEGHQSSFFKPAAENAIAMGLHLLDTIGDTVNLLNLREVLGNEAILKKKLEAFETAALKRSDIGEARQKYDEAVLEFFRREFLFSKGKDQSAGISGTVGNYLQPFQVPEIAEVTCTENPNTFSLDDFDSGMVLATSVPQRLVKERMFVHTYLKTLVYYKALRRLDKSWVQKLFMSPIGIFADEFQDIVSASEDGMGDHRVADRVRSGLVFLVGGTQSHTSPDPKIQDTRRKVLLKNMRTRFFFRQSDNEDAKLCADFVGFKTVRRRFRQPRGVLDMNSTGGPEEMHKVKPEKFLSLPDFTCYVVHPSPQTFFGTRYRRAVMKPIEPSGKVAPWYDMGRVFAKFTELITT